MNSRKIPFDKTLHFKMNGFAGNVYIPVEEGMGFNVLAVDVNGRHYRTRLKEATRVYLVMEGKGTFTLNNEVHQVKPGDLYVITGGEEYEYEGKMKLFEFNVPGTTEEDEVRLD